MARLFKRGLIWYAWIGRPGGGTFKVSTQCSDKKAAEKRAGELERDSLDPANAAANRTTTQAACDEFVDSRRRRGRAQGTLHHYGVKLGHIVRLMPTRLADLDAAACERFIATRLDEGAAQTTVKKEIRACGAMLNHARRSGLYMRDVEAVIPELEDTYKPRERFITPMELVALCHELEPDRAAHVVFIVATGARWGESVRARRADIESSMVLLRGTKTRDSWRTVPVPPTMHGALAWSLASAGDAGRLVIFRNWGDVNRDLARACIRLGIEKVTPNDLRRTFATWLRVTGLTTDLIGKALGHTTSRMADRIYGRLSPEALGKLIAERGPALDLGPKKESTVLGLLMGGESAESSDSKHSVETGSDENEAGFPVPGPGIEPGTRGFSIPSDGRETTLLHRDSTGRWVANGLTFRQRAHRWLTWEAA